VVSYYNNAIIDLNYKPTNIIDNDNNENIIINIICNDTKINLTDNPKINNKYILKDFSKLSFNKILKHYDDNNKLGDNLSDIYYYINIIINLIKKNKNIEKILTTNINTIKNYNIDKDLRLKKFIEIKDRLTDSKTLYNLTYHYTQ